MICDIMNPINLAGRELASGGKLKMLTQEGILKLKNKDSEQSNKVSKDFTKIEIVNEKCFY